MTKANSKNKISPEAIKQMQALNSNPVMSVKEYLDAEGNLLNKEVEIAPRASSSVEYCIDSKGQIKPKIKVYHEDPIVAFEVATSLMAKAIEKSVEMSQD
jgi:hypothetical protein